MKKLLVVGVIVLFLGLAIAPSINANVNKASIDSELVEITTEICGLNGGKHTVLLSKEDADEVDLLFKSIRAQLNNAESREKVVEIFKKAIIELDKYGLLDGLSGKQLQRLVVGWYQSPIKRALNKIFNRNSMMLDDDENIFCLILGKTSYQIGFERVLSRILVILAILLYNLELERLGSYFLLFWILSSIGVYENPIQILNTIGLGAHDGDTYRMPAKGWIWSLGVNGIKSWNDSFYGNLPILPIQYLVGRIYYPGIIGYTGLALHTDDFKEFYFLGTALWLKINTAPPW